jgi:hypothetical protein
MQHAEELLDGERLNSRGVKFLFEANDVDSFTDISELSKTEDALDESGLDEHTIAILKGQGPAYQNELCMLKKMYKENSMSFDFHAFFDEKGQAKEALKIYKYGMQHNIVDMQWFDKKVTKDNAYSALARFMLLDYEGLDVEHMQPKDIEIKEAFTTTDAKNVVLNKLKEDYEKYLNNGNPNDIPEELRALYHVMKKNDGAGPLTQIESFLDFFGVMSKNASQLMDVTRKIEDKFDTEKWDNQDRSNFYSISAEVISADPGLYEEFANLFVNIKDKNDFNKFTKEIYPLYRAKLALLKNYDSQHDDGLGKGYAVETYEKVDIEELKNQLHKALLPFNLQELSPEKRQEGIEKVREIIFSEIKGIFQDKFGIKPEAVPESLEKRDSRAIEDMALYLSNIAEPDNNKKDLIGFYLALQFDHKNESDGWQQLRRGVEIEPEKYVLPEKADIIRGMMAISREANPVNHTNTHIDDDGRLGKFRSDLQQETETIAVGNIQTIDIKLQNLIGNINDLKDPDLYPDKLTKEKLVILNRYPAGMTGQVSSKLWQQLNGRDVQFSEEEAKAAEDMLQLLRDNNIEVNQDGIKSTFQDKEYATLKLPFNISDKLEKEKASREIAELQDILIPPDEIISVFGRIGEEFKPHSGAMALSADLEYLENLVVKNEDKLTEDEHKKISEYIGVIRGKIAKLQEIYDSAVNSFKKIQESISGSKTASQPVLDKISEIDKIINGTGSESVIVTSCTSDIKTIIENMRACLSCKTKGCNNDTDLTFGEGNKFYLYSRNGKSRSSSVADEIVFFTPVKNENGDDMRLSFVMDRVYGQKNSNIFMNHINTMIKKASKLASEYSETPISVFVPFSSGESCLVEMDDLEGFSRKLNLPEGARVTLCNDNIVDVPMSGYGEHYIEFGGDERTAGKRSVSGFEIRF